MSIISKSTLQIITEVAKESILYDRLTSINTITNDKYGNA